MSCHYGDWKHCEECESDEALYESGVRSGRKEADAIIWQMLDALWTCKYEYVKDKCFQFYDDKLVEDAIQSAEEMLNKEKKCNQRNHNLDMVIRKVLSL